MIVKISNQLIEVVTELDDLEIKHGNQKDMQDTLTELEGINSLVGILKAQIQTLQTSIDEYQSQYISHEAVAVRTDIDRAHTDFESVFRQVAQLQVSHQRLEDLNMNIRAAWGEYVEKTVKPYRNLFEQIKRLPEVSGVSVEIESMLSEVSALGQTPPQSETVLNKVEKKFAKLHKLFSDKVDLSSSVREFLSKVLDGNATFNDLNDEVLEWISESDRAQAFRISFLKS